MRELERYIVGQDEAKRAVAVALRNRYRRSQLSEDMREEISPKNILMIGPTGVGKTEIARRLAKLVDAPFIKVEATKFTEVGYVGRDVNPSPRPGRSRLRMVKSRRERVRLRAQVWRRTASYLILHPIKRRATPSTSCWASAQGARDPQEEKQPFSPARRTAQKAACHENRGPRAERGGESRPRSDPGAPVNIGDRWRLLPKKTKLRRVKVARRARSSWPRRGKVIDNGRRHRGGVRRASRRHRLPGEIDKMPGVPPAGTARTLPRGCTGTS